MLSVVSASHFIQQVELEYETDSKGRTRLKYSRTGWNRWMWQSDHGGPRQIAYARAGTRGSPPVLLVHGYGASTYHWRYQFKALSDAGFEVFAIDLLGFGLSEKAAVDYTNGSPWVSQIQAFKDEVVGRPFLAIAGNSLGAYACLAAAAKDAGLAKGIALLNGAGPFRDSSAPKQMPDPPNPLVKSVTDAVKRLVLYFAFLWAKQPIRIKQVLGLVYSTKDQLDADLVDSIEVPAQDPDAFNVFFRVNNRSEETVPMYVDDLLEPLAARSAPLLLLWGAADPWVVPARANKIKELYPQSQLVLLENSGHCPHDDTPEETNAELIKWLKALQ
jgi:pimeloyl-ACP methyl ester carboxylesterase